jgi:hypothetical protein
MELGDLEDMQEADFLSKRGYKQPLFFSVLYQNITIVIPPEELGNSLPSAGGQILTIRHC